MAMADLFLLSRPTLQQLILDMDYRKGLADIAKQKRLQAVDQFTRSSLQPVGWGGIRG